MTPYIYNCPDCGPVEKRCRMADRDAQTCDCGAPLVRDLAAQFRSQGLKLFFFNKSSFYDRIPPEVKGAGPNSKVYRDYASRIETPSSGPDIAPSTFKKLAESL